MRRDEKPSRRRLETDNTFDIRVMHFCVVVSPRTRLAFLRRVNRLLKSWSIGQYWLFWKISNTKIRPTNLPMRSKIKELLLRELTISEIWIRWNEVKSESKSLGCLGESFMSSYCFRRSLKEHELISFHSERKNGLIFLINRFFM